MQFDDVSSLCVYLHLNCVTSILEQTSTFCDVLKEKIDGVSVADDLFQSSRSGDFDVTPTTVGGCSTYSLCSLGGQSYICL